MGVQNYSDVIAWKNLRERWRENPAAYMQYRIGRAPTSQQRQLLNAIAPEDAKVSIRAGHGLGKTACLAVVVFWYLECFDHAKIPCTAPSSSQLRDVLWSELAKLVRISDLTSKANGLPSGFWLSDLFRITQDRVLAIGHEGDWFAVARTARKEAPEALQGFHASDISLSEDGSAIETIGKGGNLLFLVDEASGVPDEIYTVAEAALTSAGSRFLMVGNPTRGKGYFADSHKKNRDSFTTLHFSCKDSILVPSSYRERLVKNFGENSNMVRVRADGEFPKQDDDALISLELLEPCLHREARPCGDELFKLGVDVARFGDDRTVFILRQGHHVSHIEIHSKDDTMVTSGRVAMFCQLHHVDEIYVDVCGLGAGVADRLRELNFSIVDVNVAEKAPERRKDVDSIDMIPNKLRDFLWLESLKFFQHQEPSFECCDKDYVETLIGELSTVGYTFNSSGCIVVHSKDKLKKDGLRSPDIADALNLTFAVGSGSIWERLGA